MVVPTHTMLRAALKPVCQRTDTGLEQVSTHTMLRAALKHRHPHTTNLLLAGPDTHNAACGIETPKNVDNAVQVLSLDTHNAACGIETADTAYNLRSLLPVSTHTMLRAALKHLLGTKSLRQQFVSTHTMLRAALKLWTISASKPNFAVSTHTMLRAALKPQRMWIMPSKFLCLDTHNAACGIETF